jgi:hypothetical protein
MNDLNPDRWLEHEADRYLTEQHRNAAALVDQEQRYQHMLEFSPGARKAIERMDRGLPPNELACKFCPSMDAKEFDGIGVCKRCCEGDGGIRICRECGETEFIDGPEGPTMCVWCRSIDSDYSPDWEEN